MRISLPAVALALLAPAPAHADAFVPVDPPPRGFCGEAAGDGVVADRILDSHYDSRVELSEAGGPAEILRGRAPGG